MHQMGKRHKKEHYSSSSSSEGSLSDSSSSSSDASSNRKRKTKTKKSDKRQSRKDSKKSSAHRGKMTKRDKHSGLSRDTIRGEFVLPEEQCLGQKIPMKGHADKPAVCSGVLYFAKKRSWLFKQLKKCVFLPDSCLNQSLVKAMMSLFPERQVEDVESEDEDTRSKPKVQYVSPGIKTSVASAYEIMKAVGLGPGTNGDSSVTLEKFQEFLKDNGVNVKDDAPSKLAANAGLGKRKSESSTKDSTTTKKMRGNDATVDLTTESSDVPKTPPHSRTETKGPDSVERVVAKLRANGMVVVPSSCIMPPPPSKPATSGASGATSDIALSSSPPITHSPVSTLAPVPESESENRKVIETELEKATKLFDEDLRRSIELGFIPDDVIAGISEKDLDRKIADFACKNSASVDAMLVHVNEDWRRENIKLRASSNADEFRLRIMMGMREHAWLLMYGIPSPKDDDFLMGNGYGAAVVAKWSSRSKSRTPSKKGAAGTE
jgi:hypothetical protein